MSICVSLGKGRKRKKRSGGRWYRCTTTDTVALHMPVASNDINKDSGILKTLTQTFAVAKSSATRQRSSAEGFHWPELISSHALHAHSSLEGRSRTRISKTAGSHSARRGMPLHDYRPPGSRYFDMTRR